MTDALRCRASVKAVELMECIRMANERIDMRLQYQSAPYSQAVVGPSCTYLEELGGSGR